MRHSWRRVRYTRTRRLMWASGIVMANPRLQEGPAMGFSQGNQPIEALSASGPDVDKVIERLKEQAEKLGANGIILERFSDRETGSVRTGVGSDSYSRNSSVGGGVGGSLG